MTIKEKFTQLKKQGKKAFIAYVPFGFPTINHTKDIVLTLQDAGVDIIELGIPFSDPIADGPIIQAATTIALSRGATTDKLFTLLKNLKKDISIPIALMTYYNPVLQYGMKRFFSQMNQACASGLLVVDLPIDESSEYIKEARATNIETIFFATPVTPREREKQIIASSRGFLYYVSVTGTTGPQELCYTALRAHVSAIKKTTTLPVCVGFGIHTRRQIETINTFSDGVIVGSDLVRSIGTYYKEKNFLHKLKLYIHTLMPKAHTR